MSRILSKAVAERRLKRELPLVQRCISGAWQEYMDRPAEYRLADSPRTRASTVHDLMVKRARELFEPLVHAQCLEIGGLFIVTLYQRLAIRFKKLDGDFRACNIPTQQSLEFVRQQSSLVGIKDVMNLQAGYRLNGLQTELEGSYLACPRGRGNYWIIELDPYAGAKVVELPEKLKASPTSTAVKLKHVPTEKKGGEDFGN